MAGLPQNFQALSPVIASYTFVDIASGTGYITFYAGNTVDKYLLSNYTYYSDVNALSENVPNNTSNYTKFIDVDFDVVLNRPLDVRGMGILNVPVGGNSNQIRIQVTAILRKWDGSTETDIVTNTSSEWVCPGTAFKVLAIDLDTPLTHFKIGETLRLTIQLYAKNLSATNTYTVYLANDPANRTDGWDASGAVPSKLTFQCPVRLNL